MRRFLAKDRAFPEMPLEPSSHHLQGARVGPVQRVALTKREAADALGISIDSFERHVQHELRVVRRGRLRLVPVDELKRWISENAERPLEPWEARGLASDP